MQPNELPLMSWQSNIVIPIRLIKSLLHHNEYVHVWPVVTVQNILTN